MKWVGGQEGADSWTVSCRRGGGEPEVEIKGNLWVDLLVVGGLVSGTPVGSQWK